MSAEHSGDSTPSRAPGEAGEIRDPVEALVEEFFERRRRGERVDSRDFARRVPGREAEFEELVAGLDPLEVAAAPSAAAPDAPRRLGRFEIRRLVGRGGMGAVYEAHDAQLDRLVALKVLPGWATLDPRETERFRREAKAAA